MKYSYNWLQQHIEQPLPSPDALRETIIFHAFEVESVEQVEGDTIFDIKVLPDRAGDCLSHYGMAREIAGLTGLTLRPLDLAELPVLPLKTKVEVESDLCRRYMAIEIQGVRVDESPEYLKSALARIGQKSINNIVDATNYVLWDLGQPTHAYDKANVDGGIVVRSAKTDEKILTLSEEEKILTPDMLVIADYIGPLGIAGVKGGKNAKVEEGTTSVILEIANFDPSAVRKTARALALPTDAAKRFENNLSPEVAYQAAAQLVALIKDIAGGEVVGVYDYYPQPQVSKTITFTTQAIASLLGPVSEAAIANVFDRYTYAYTCTDGTFVLTVPLYREDITGVHDIAEEVGRVIGYDSVVPMALPFTPVASHSPIYQALVAARAWLVHDGFREVMTYTFRKKGMIEVARGPKGKSFLRTNLSDGLKESFDLNALHAPLLNPSKIRLFEIGTVFLVDHEEIHVATVDEKGTIVESTLQEYIDIHKIVTTHTELEHDETNNPFMMWSSYPLITRDVAVWVQSDQDIQVLEDIIHTFAQERCAVPAVCFDTFIKDEKTSVAYRLVFQAKDRTLTDKEVEDWMKPLYDAISSKFSLR